MFSFYDISLFWECNKMMKKIMIIIKRSLLCRDDMMRQFKGEERNETI